MKQIKNRTPYEHSSIEGAEWDRIIKAIAFRNEKDQIRAFWHKSRSEAFCPHYWLLDYKQSRKAGLEIGWALRCTNLDVSGK